MRFNESEKYCNKINGSIVSNILGSKGKKYHKYYSKGIKKLKFLITISGI